MFDNLVVMNCGQLGLACSLTIKTAHLFLINWNYFVLGQIDYVDSGYPVSFQHSILTSSSSFQ